MVWVEMSGRNIDAADAVLQHEKRLSKIARKYAKHDYQAERAGLLREWADYAMSIVDRQLGILTEPRTSAVAYRHVARTDAHGVKLPSGLIRSEWASRLRPETAQSPEWHHRAATRR
jgi:hypothetical protein